MSDQGINDVLVAIVGDCIKAEVDAMVAAGMSTESVNVALPHIVKHYAEWHENSARKIAAERDRAPYKIYCI